MRPARKAVTAAVTAVVATGLGAAPAAADGISISPHSPRPGQRIHISVPGCSVGPTPHIAKSAAFAHDVTLYGKADTGEGDPKLKKNLRPGPYAIVASCGDGSTVRGEVVVVAKDGKPGPTGMPSSVLPPKSTSPRPPASLSATPAASQSHSGSKTLLLAIGGAIAALLVLGGAGLLVVRRRNH
ncbi:MAG: hypothetical protein ACJ72W_29100 [Actinoallomurus sp.]